MIIKMVAKESDPEAAAHILEAEWKAEVNFWEEFCSNNPIHEADKDGTNGLAELRNLTSAKPDEHLSGKLLRLLKLVLDIWDS